MKRPTVSLHLVNVSGETLGGFHVGEQITDNLVQVDGAVVLTEVYGEGLHDRGHRRRGQLQRVVPLHVRVQVALLSEPKQTKESNI